MNTQERGEYTSASSAPADSLCPGRHLAQRGIESLETKDASHGTKIHNALAKQDPQGLDVDQESVYDSCNKIEEKLVSEYFPEAGGAKSTPTREKRYWVGWGGGLKHSGQIDSVHRLGARALIVEYKTLTGEVGISSKNEQLRDQVCIYNANSELIEEVGVAVIQPLVTHSPEICVYDRSSIEMAMSMMYSRVLASNNPNSPRVAGPVQCKFCLAKSSCAEYAKYSSAFATVPAKSAQIVSALSAPVSAWSPEQRAMFLDHMETAQSWLDLCKSEIKKLMKANPDCVPGYELKAGSNRSTIENVQAVFDNYIHRGGDAKPFMSCVGISKTDLKAVVRETMKLKGKALDLMVDEIIGGNVSVKQSEPSIVKK